MTLGRVKAILDEAPSLASQRLADGESPLMAALYRGHHDVVAALIEAGAEIDVFAAAALGRIDDLRRALKTAGSGQRPAPTTAGRRFTSRRFSDSSTPPASCWTRAPTSTPFPTTACRTRRCTRRRRGSTPTSRLLLLDHGAEADSVDAGGYTPLQIATQNHWSRCSAMIGTGSRASHRTRASRSERGR